MDNSSTFTISSEKYCSRTLHIFRKVSRTVSGESLEPKDTDLVLFGRTQASTEGVHIRKHNADVVSVASGRSQKIYISDNPHDEDLYHWINFLFVMKDFQGNGYGKQMLAKMERLLWFQSPATIRIESASKAVAFFKKMGYTEVSQPIECVHSGSALFRTLQVMEKPFQRGF